MAKALAALSSPALTQVLRRSEGWELQLPRSRECGGLAWKELKSSVWTMHSEHVYETICQRPPRDEKVSSTKPM